MARTDGTELDQCIHDIMIFNIHVAVVKNFHTSHTLTQGGGCWQGVQGWSREHKEHSGEHARAVG